MGKDLERGTRKVKIFPLRKGKVVTLPPRLKSFVDVLEICRSEMIGLRFPTVFEDSVLTFCLENKVWGKKMTPKLFRVQKRRVRLFARERKRARSSDFFCGCRPKKEKVLVDTEIISLVCSWGGVKSRFGGWGLGKRPIKGYKGGVKFSP